MSYALAGVSMSALLSTHYYFVDVDFTHGDIGFKYQRQRPIIREQEIRVISLDVRLNVIITVWTSASVVASSVSAEISTNVMFLTTPAQLSR